MASTTEFHRVNINTAQDDNFIRGAARVMWAGITIAMPTKLADMFNLSTYDVAANWNDLGGTKTGVSANRNFTEETFDIDQVEGDIDSMPTGFTLQMATALEEVDLEHIQIAWQGGDITSANQGYATERTLGIGAPLFYIRRRLAILHRRSNNKVRAVIFRKANIAPQESSMVFNKTGEQQALPVLFSAYPDLSINVPENRHALIIDQS